MKAIGLNAIRVAALALLSAAVPTASRGEPAIEVLSNRPDLISGGDVLIQIVLPAGVPPTAATLLRNGTPAAAALGIDGDGRFLARVTRLDLGANVLTVQLPGGAEASATVVNHPNGGPVFSGPQIQPWTCQVGAVDAQCNQPVEYTLLYKSTDPTQGLQPYDPDNPPTDVASTTTDENVTVPFIVRQERGYQDRDEYKILTLFQPGQPWQPWAPQEQWNHKVLVTHGGGCGGDYHPDGAPLEDYAGTIPANPVFEQSYIAALGRGFAVMSTALDNNGHNCNIAVQAESLMMAKERLVEQYGPLRYTIGTGCSGGSLVQQQVSNAYPGIYQGLLTTCAYPDTFSAGAQFADYHMLRTYFEDPSKWGRGVVWSPTQFADVEGHLSHLNAIAADELLFKGATNPEGTCVAADQVYHSDTNPGGVRCGILDYQKTILGPRPPQVWSANEQLVGHGFGGSFIDNVGIQYGLGALRGLKITPAQFVDLNVEIGGLDIDIQPSASRIAADEPALTNAYRSGSINDGSHLDAVAIIDAYGPDPGIAHDTVHTWWMRWRLDREHGHHDNHVIWGGPAPLIGDPNYTVQSLVAMDRWLAAIEADGSNTPLPQKVRAHRPADIHDQCSDGAGTKILDDLCPEAVTPVFGTPRTVAGDVNTADTMKCQLKPLNRSDDYGPLGLLTFTDDQWAQLEAAYPDGVCDYSKPAVEFQHTITWMSYQDAAGNVIYGGTPLPPAPVNVAPGWVDGGFFLPEPGRISLLGAGIALLVVLGRTRREKGRRAIRATGGRNCGRRPVCRIGERRTTALHLPPFRPGAHPLWPQARIHRGKNGAAMRQRTIQAVMAMTLMIGAANAAAADVPAPDARCAADAVAAGTVCLDRYEVSAWRVPDPNTANASLVAKIQLGSATRGDLGAAGATPLGGRGDDYAPCTDDGQNCGDLYAVSIPSVVPAAFVTWFQAQAACANSGKRLPTSAEWQVGANGSPDPGPDDGILDCNTARGTAALTGERSRCVSARGAFDAVGNLSEWVADWMPFSSDCPGWASFSGDFMCLAGATTKSGPGALLRGGSFFDGATAGPFAVSGALDPTRAEDFVGFRCARPLPEPGSSAQLAVGLAALAMLARRRGCSA